MNYRIVSSADSIARISYQQCRCRRGIANGAVVALSSLPGDPPEWDPLLSAASKSNAALIRQMIEQQDPSHSNGVNQSVLHIASFGFMVRTALSQCLYYFLFHFLNNKSWTIFIRSRSCVSTRRSRHRTAHGPVKQNGSECCDPYANCGLAGLAWSQSGNSRSIGVVGHVT